LAFCPLTPRASASHTALALPSRSLNWLSASCVWTLIPEFWVSSSHLADGPSYLCFDSLWPGASPATLPQFQLNREQNRQIRQILCGVRKGSVFGKHWVWAPAGSASHTDQSLHLWASIS
jgi:hypothetical protein